jgi:hypothetical protein
MAAPKEKSDADLRLPTAYLSRGASLAYAFAAANLRSGFHSDL